MKYDFKTPDAIDGNIKVDFPFNESIETEDYLSDENRCETFMRLKLNPGISWYNVLSF